MKKMRDWKITYSNSSTVKADCREMAIRIFREERERKGLERLKITTITVVREKNDR